MNIKNKTVFITGASRGIGKAIALKLASAGANIVIAAKSTEENSKLGGTIYSAAKEVELAGAKALSVPCDIRFEDQVQQAVQQAVQQFGGIDVLINNASAIALSSIETTTAKAYDLMFNINVRGTFFVSQACIPYLKKQTGATIITMSPPLSFKARWFEAHTAYTASKYGMTMMTIGLANELKKYSIAACTLWPQTVIATAAVKNILGGEALIAKSRHPSIVSDAVFSILQKPYEAINGKHFIDEALLKADGITNFEHYAVNPQEKLYPDLFID